MSFGVKPSLWVERFGDWNTFFHKMLKKEYSHSLWFFISLPNKALLCKTAPKCGAASYFQLCGLPVNCGPPLFLYIDTRGTSSSASVSLCSDGVTSEQSGTGIFSTSSEVFFSFSIKNVLVSLCYIK